MLPRTQRLNTGEFAVVFKNSRVLRHPLLQLRFYKHGKNHSDASPDASKGKRQNLKRCADETRAAFVAPKKLGNAVVRNAIRRRVRERYRLMRAEALRIHNWHSALENCDLVFLATEQCRAATSVQIDESLSYLLKQLVKRPQQKNGLEFK